MRRSTTRWGALVSMIAVSELPFTGSNTPALAGLGGLLLVSGAALVAATRRRGRPA